MMNTWTPLWGQIVDSTLWEEELEVRVLFLTMLAVKEPDHVVRMPLRRLCKKANMTMDVCEKALQVLVSPDGKSTEAQDFEGRRIKRVEDGWLVLNGQKYFEEMRRLQRRAYKTDWQREKRAGSKLVTTQSERVAEKLRSEGKDCEADRLEDLAEAEREVRREEFAEAEANSARETIVPVPEVEALPAPKIERPY